MHPKLGCHGLCEILCYFKCYKNFKIVLLQYIKTVFSTFFCFHNFMFTHYVFMCHGPASFLYYFVASEFGLGVSLSVFPTW